MKNNEAGGDDAGEREYAVKNPGDEFHKYFLFVSIVPHMRVYLKIHRASI